MVNEKKKILGALRFLTIFNFPGDEELRGASAYFPLVGWVVGGFLFASNWLLFFLPSLARAFLVVFFWELISRWFHLDALADAADAFFKGGSKKDILRIMSDTKVGSFGNSAIIFLVLGKVVFLSSLDFMYSLFSLLAAPLFARYLVTLLCFFFPSAKKEGLGSAIDSTTGLRELIVATLFLLPAIFVFKASLLLPLIGLFLIFILGFFAVRKAGGLTGDILGALLEGAEVLIILLFLVFQSLTLR